MPLATLDARLQVHADSLNPPAIITAETTLSYAQLLDSVVEDKARLQSLGISAGDAVLLSCGFTPAAISCFLALLRLNAVAVLCAPDEVLIEQKMQASGAVLHVPDGQLDNCAVESVDRPSESHPLIAQLVEAQSPGFVVFSSGSSGEPKAVLHNATQFSEHLKNVKKAKSTIGFLAFDHIAGIDTLLYTLFAGGTLIVPEDRSPRAVCEAVSVHRAQVLPVSPSFLKLLLISPALTEFDLSSLEIITFGSEPPDPTVIKRFADLLPHTQLLQKYGTSEFGAPRSVTRPGDSRWLKLESENFKIRVIDGILWVKASGTMLGYLNAESRVDNKQLAADGWFCTGDRVEQDGEWLRILGRDSDLINVGGEKVFPAEVETVIEQLPEVLECAVSGEAHPLMGSVVVATVRLSEPLDPAAAKRLVRSHCRTRLARYAIPVKVRVTTDNLTSDRGKRLRR